MKRTFFVSYNINGFSKHGDTMVTLNTDSLDITRLNATIRGELLKYLGFSKDTKITFFSIIEVEDKSYQTETLKHLDNLINIIEEEGKNTDGISEDYYDNYIKAKDFLESIKEKN